VQNNQFIERKEMLQPKRRLRQLMPHQEKIEEVIEVAAAVDVVVKEVEIKAVEVVDHKLLIKIVHMENANPNIKESRKMLKKARKLKKKLRQLNKSQPMIRRLIIETQK
jgi:hypothetical protein